jgi:hypothetical protein
VCIRAQIRRPCATALWHVSKVHDLDVGAILLLALDANRIAAGTGGGERSGIVASHYETVGGGVGQIEALRGRPTDVAAEKTRLVLRW